MPASKSVSAGHRLAFIGQGATTTGVHQDTFPGQVDPQQTILPVLEAREAGGGVVALQSVVTSLPIDFDQVGIARIALNFNLLPELATIDTAGEFEIQLLLAAFRDFVAGRRSRRLRPKQRAGSEYA